MEKPDAWHLTDRVPHEQGEGDPFAAAVRATRMPMIITDPRQHDNPIVFVNDAFLELTGYGRDEIMGRNCRFLQGDHTDHDAVKRLRDAIDARQDIMVEILNYRKDGTPFCNALYVSPVFSHEGELQFFFASQLDTTEQTKAQEALKQREAELRMIVEGASDYAIITTNLDQIVTSWSIGAEKSFGWTAQEMIGQSIRMIYTSADRAEGVPEREIGAAAEEGCANDVRWHQRKDGGQVFMNGLVRPLPRDERGKGQGFIKIARDETDRKRIDDRLHELNENLEAQVAARTGERNQLWELSRDVMLRFTREGRILTVNPAWSDSLGWQEPELVGSSLFNLMHPDDREDARTQVIATGNGHDARFEQRYRHRDGSYRWISWSLGVADDVILAVGRDTTAEREAAEALSRAEEALRQSQKMEAIGQLTGGVAHDFNNLLTVIRGSVDLLRREGIPTDKRQRYLDAIGDTADRAAKLTGQLLAFARRQTLEPETFEVGQRLDAISDMLDSITGARVVVRMEMPEAVCRIRADISQFETALVNLAVNARDAMDGEGTITIRLTCGSHLPAIRGHGGSSGNFVAISVADTGIGIVPTDLERIFEPFFTTKEIGRGTGLGLSQVFGFAKQSGGDVDVASTPGRGATFTLYLPQVEATADQQKVATVMTESANGEGRCVLVVEDNVSVGQFATQLLDDLGYRTKWVMTAEEALERLGGDGAGFDIVFSDVVMPGMGGVELARRLAHELPFLPVILASGYSHVLAQEGVEGLELLRKPYSANQLSTALQRRIAWAAEQKE